MKFPGRGSRVILYSAARRTGDDHWAATGEIHQLAFCEIPLLLPKRHRTKVSYILVSHFNLRHIANDMPDEETLVEFYQQSFNFSYCNSLGVQEFLASAMLMLERQLPKLANLPNGRGFWQSAAVSRAQNQAGRVPPAVNRQVLGSRPSRGGKAKGKQACGLFSYASAGWPTAREATPATQVAAGSCGDRADKTRRKPLSSR